ncbi:MAG: hypothetical protein JWR07_178 [Nevskia sp.]|nr:hypothetical protein [Nevskia sp.]
MGVALSQEAADFDVPAQDASTGLSALAIQGNFELMIPPKLVQGRSIHQVHGHYTPSSALAKAMHGTGLAYKAVSDHAYAIQAEVAEPTTKTVQAQPPPPQLSSAGPTQPVELEGVTVVSRTLKTPEYGEGEIFSINRAAPLPLDKTYEQLTEEQRHLYRSWYVSLGENDEPPFPEGGMMNLFERTISMHNLGFGSLAGRYGVEGRYFVLAHVDEKGVAHSIEISQVGNFEPTDLVKNFLGAVYMSQKYKPGRCNGTPCAMDFGVSINMTPRY